MLASVVHPGEVNRKIVVSALPLVGVATHVPLVSVKEGKREGRLRRRYDEQRADVRGLRITLGAKEREVR